MKKRVYVDQDGVLCNFDDASRKAIIENPSQRYPQSQWGFFLKLEEIPGAIEGIRILQEKYDVWILTRPSFKNVNCFTEKAQWILDHFDFELLEKTIMCGDKSLVKGDYLIDDRNTDKQSEFEGEWIEFGNYDFPDWETVVNYLMNK